MQHQRLFQEIDSWVYFMKPDIMRMIIIIYTLIFSQPLEIQCGGVSQRWDFIVLVDINVINIHADQLSDAGLISY